MYKQFFSYFLVIIFIFIIFINIIYYYKSSPNIFSESIITDFAFSDNSDFAWPIPGFHNITSPFGTRIHPITQKKSTHQGMDISAPPGTYLYATYSGIVTLANYNGANGYSIHISNNNFTFIYGHVSPNYLVSVRRFCYKRSNNWTSWSKTN